MPCPLRIHFAIRAFWLPISETRRAVLKKISSVKTQFLSQLAFMFFIAGKFFNSSHEALIINQSDTTTSAGTFQTVRFNLAEFAHQINLRPAQTGEWTMCAGRRKAHEAWLQLQYTRRRASVPHFRIGRRLGA